MSRLGNFRYETLTLGSAGAKVFFERIERSTLTANGAILGYPEGTPLELRIAGVGTIDTVRCEIIEWRDFFTLPHLQKHPSFPEGMPTIA